MENLEDTQDFHEYNLSDVYPHDAGKHFYGYGGNESFAKRGYKFNND